MYAREVEKKTLTFGVSGMLWNRSLVMYDKETGSLWSHILGEAMQGPLKGTRLEQVPSVMTDWQSWRTEHPESTVVLLSRTSGDYRRQFYRQPEQFVLGIAEGSDAMAWGFDTLVRNLAINDQWALKPVVAAFDRTSMTARLYSRRLEGRVLTFRAVDGKLTDEETGSTWAATTGRAMAGPLAGKHLEPLPAFVSFRQVWFAFHPKSRVHPDSR